MYAYFQSLLYNRIYNRENNNQKIKNGVACEGILVSSWIGCAAALLCIAIFVHCQLFSYCIYVQIRIDVFVRVFAARRQWRTNSLKLFDSFVHNRILQ